MGLDAVEIIMECEDEFGVAIPDAAASGIRTVGDLHQLILSLLGPATGDVCASARAFYHLRRAMVADGLPRRDIAPASRLATILPRHRRHGVWNQIAASGLKLPPLQYPPAAINAVMAIGVTGLFAAWAWVGGVLGFLAGIATFVILLLLGFCILLPVKRTLPASCQTVGDFARAMIGRNRDAFAMARRHSDKETWSRVRRIVASQLRINEERITPQARFVEDLGI